MKQPLAVLIALAITRVALANPQPLVGADDVRSAGPVALNHIEPSFAAQLSSGPGKDDAVALYTLQLGLSPTRWTGKLGEIFGWSKRYGAHARFTIVDRLPGDAKGGPMTLSLHRYYPVTPLDFAPLLHLHTGLSFSVATPWLSGRTESIPEVLQITNAVHTELADNGWSVRPLDVYMRIDFLACRALYLEGGGAAEVFVPTADEAPASYHLRGRVQLGLALGCRHKAKSWRTPLAVMLEYRARTRVYQRAAPAAYFEQVAAGVQYNFGRLLFGVFYSTDPGGEMLDYYAVSARVQVGLWGTR